MGPGPKAHGPRAQGPKWMLLSHCNTIFEKTHFLKKSTFYMITQVRNQYQNFANGLSSYELFVKRLTFPEHNMILPSVFDIF